MQNKRYGQRNHTSCPAAAAAKSLQSCPTLCDPTEGSPPGSSIPGILQARTLERVAIFFSNAWKRKVKVKLLSHVRLFATPWTVAYQAPLSMRFSRQEYWSEVPFPSPTSCPIHFISVSSIIYTIWVVFVTLFIFFTQLRKDICNLSLTQANDGILYICTQYKYTCSHVFYHGFLIL